MRLAVSLIAACFMLAAQPAAAQQTAPPAPATQTFAPSHLGAAHDTLQAMLIDSGVLSTASLEAFRIVTPQFRTAITSTPLYTSLSAEKQRQVSAYIDGFPPIGQQETLLGAPELIDRFTPQMAGSFAENELNDITTFLRTPEGQAFFLRAVMDGVRGAAPGATPPPPTPPTEAETQALLRFSLTPGGAAMDARAEALSPMMREIGRSATGSPRVALRLRRDLCAILAEQCPAAWRTT